MKAILLAAGKGTRISRYINEKPKCSVDIGKGKTLISYTIDNLKENDIEEIYIVTGYKKNIIEEILKNENVNFIYNPFFNVTNSIASLWFAKNFLTDDVIIMNADVFLEKKAFKEILNCTINPVMFYDTSKIETADYRFNCKDDKIVKYGKDLSNEDTTGEYVGLAKMTKDFLPIYLKKLDEMIDNQINDVWWENVLYSLTSDYDIYVKDLSNYFWAEIDYVEDYNRIIEYFNEKYI